ncbi:MAG: 50S ribosomal protein L18 [Planctomycetota bacterium]|jgi:large subunit ribosomal protein L18|nr:50S ribosomal protein L18 [Planctomycetota bacterium]
MDTFIKKNAQLKRRHLRLRNKITGTAERPRLYVFRTAKHIYAQIIDDVAGKTLASATSNVKAFGQSGGNIAGAKKVGELLAQTAKAKNIETVVFDRGGRKYHGRVKALADGVRAGGVKF